MEYPSSHLYFHSTYGVNTSDKCDIPWYSTKERCITILYHEIEYTVANTFNLANMKRMMGCGCNTVKYIWVIDHGGGQDGWRLAKFFFACLWTKTESRSINTHKKRTRPISSHLAFTKVRNGMLLVYQIFFVSPN